MGENQGEAIAAILEITGILEEEFTGDEKDTETIALLQNVFRNNQKVLAVLN